MRDFAFFVLILLSISNAYAQQEYPITKRFTSFDGTKIYFEIYGKGKPVILIHGFTGTSESWTNKPVFDDLIKKGFKVILVDLRGNGKSDKPLTEKAYLDDAEAKDVMALMYSLQIQSYHAVGYSRGSIIVSRLLVLDKRVNRGVMGGMGEDFTNPEWPRRIMFYEVLSGKRNEPSLDGFLKYVREKKLDEKVLALQQFGQPCTSVEELGKITKRVLVVCGTEDQDNGSAESLAMLLPKSDYITVPGDHNNASQNRDFSDAVVGFLLSP